MMNPDDNKGFVNEEPIENAAEEVLEDVGTVEEQWKTPPKTWLRK